MPQYDDLFLRTELSDTGQYPSTAATAYYSPDIIVWGTEPLEDPDVFLSENYGKTWYKNVLFEQANYIYCRAKNLSSASQTGKLYLYYANGGLLSDVAKWRQNVIGTAIPDQNYVDLSARREGQSGDITAGNSAFVWTPPVKGHYCFIAQITTEDHPNPLPQSFKDQQAYVKWILDNPAVAWRNLSIVDSTDKPEFQEEYNFQNLDPDRREYLFLMQTTSLPVETSLTMISGAVGPEPPINTGTVVRRGNTSLSQTSTLPAHFDGSLLATVKLPTGQQWGPSMKVTIDIFAITKMGDQTWFKELGTPLKVLDATNPDLADREDVAVRLGRFTVQTDTES
ncbi:hypothetical protein [Labrenzia sp. PHM005]|uniref:hypothetical protein n=1 Tax=Labrenzia sp. PHM005 TaxID=2590016 RepID=UPI00113FFDA4|nr:hypothetical protein [Labrenzia sp. PHM005]QDG79139.1 hypothetical protein FJ695_26545 [Labrenzia sp. PHM005]